MRIQKLTRNIYLFIYLFILRLKYVWKQNYFTLVGDLFSTRKHPTYLTFIPAGKISVEIMRGLPERIARVSPTAPYISRPSDNEPRLSGTEPFVDQSTSMYSSKDCDDTMSSTESLL
jgi:hypothetical protein